MRVTVYGHTGTVGSVLYRWLRERTPVELGGIALDGWDDKADQHPDWVFICVPTPTGPEGQDQKAIDFVVQHVARCHPKQPLAVVIRSTVLPGTCDRIAREHPEWRVYHWPEFLSARTAWEDFCAPRVQIVGGDGIEWSDVWYGRLPKAVKGTLYLDLTTAELVKYAHNCHGAMQVIFGNLLCDMIQAASGDMATLKAALPLLGYVNSRLVGAYWDVWRDGERGYAGACFPKDVDAVRHWLAGQAELLDGMAAANARLRGEA